jgi:hypothetical protein
MGHHVGAIPSIIGGRGIQLSHVGCVFHVTPQSLPRWKGWYRHVMRDQLAVWVPACFVGVALPSMLSVEFLRRGTEAGNWNAAAMTATEVGRHVASPPPDVLASVTGLSTLIHGTGWGNAAWAMTLLCGFLALALAMVTTVDGVLRRWVDVFWTASARLRQLDPEYIRYVYFLVLMVYSVLGIATLWLNTPTDLIKIATLIYNFALGFSCFHVLAVNTVLLPRPLRPNVLVRIGLVLGGIFFTLLGAIAAYQTFRG